jgi:hypothetical protein
VKAIEKQEDKLEEARAALEAGDNETAHNLVVGV